MVSVGVGTTRDSDVSTRSPVTRSTLIPLHWGGVGQGWSQDESGRLLLPTLPSVISIDGAVEGVG